MSYTIVSTNKAIKRSDGVFIPLNMNNRDCRQFLDDWKAGVTVTNADGSTASYNEASVEAMGLIPSA